MFIPQGIFFGDKLKLPDFFSINKIVVSLFFWRAEAVTSSPQLLNSYGHSACSVSYLSLLFEHRAKEVVASFSELLC